VLAVHLLVLCVGAPVLLGCLGTHCTSINRMCWCCCVTRVCWCSLYVYYQDVLVLNCSSEFYHKTKVLATARTALKQQGVVGLSQAPCLCALLNNLPVILQQQHTCEKVSTSFYRTMLVQSAVMRQ